MDGGGQQWLAAAKARRHTRWALEIHRLATASACVPALLDNDHHLPPRNMTSSVYPLGHWHRKITHFL